MDWAVSDGIPRLDNLSFALGPTAGGYTYEGPFELIAATPYDITGLTIIVFPQGDNFSSETRFWVMRGPAGSEVDAIPYLNGIVANGQGTSTYWPLGFWPINIPKGERLSLKIQTRNGGGGSLAAFQAIPYSGSLRSVPAIQHWQVGGVGYTMPTSAGSSAWQEQNTVTDGHWKWLTLLSGGVGTTAADQIAWTIDVAIGPVGSERIIFTCQGQLWRGGGGGFTGTSGPIVRYCGPCNIPPGTRVSGRVSFLGGTSNPTTFDIFTYGGY